MFSKVIWLLASGGLTFLMIKWRKQIIEFTGKWGWAERFLGMGGSYTAVVLIAMILFVIVLLSVTGQISGVMQATLGRIFP